MSKRPTVLFVDGSAGASGDMILGALVDLGVPLARIRREVATLPIEGWTLRSRRTTRCGLVARKVDVRIRGDQPARGWRSLRRILRGGGLSAVVRDRALAIFRRLIEAEAEVHGRPAEEVHLHEVGAVDAIVDVVGAAVGFDHLAPGRIHVSMLTTGAGRVSSAHGDYPVPAPATLALMRDHPMQAGPVAVERLTPTGAAILTTVADTWGPCPPLVPRRVGYGAGDRELGDHANLLRMIHGDSVAVAGAESLAPGDVVAIECTIDDSTPQALAYALERLREGGALETYTTPVFMKKGRSGHLLTVLARPEDAGDLQGLLLRETSTLGLRFRNEGRVELERSLRRVRTPYGEVRVKLGSLGRAVIQVWPEYDDCAAAARRHGVPLTEVQQAALRAYDNAARPRGRAKPKKL